MPDEIRADMSDEEKMAKLEAHPWFQSRPPIIQEAIRRYPGHRTYVMPKTNQIVQLHSYSEPEQEGGEVTVTVDVLGRTDCPDETWPLIQRRVFGIPLSDLEPYTEPDE